VLQNPLLSQRHIFRLDEIEKLGKFRLYVPMLRSLVPVGERINKLRWADTMEKSRLTVQDLKSF